MPILKAGIGSDVVLLMGSVFFKWSWEGALNNLLYFIFFRVTRNRFEGIQNLALEFLTSIISPPPLWLFERS